MMRRNNRLPLDADTSFSYGQWFRDNVEPSLTPTRKITHTFTTAGAAERVRHRLGTIPEGFRVVNQDKAGQLYRDADTPAADTFYIWLTPSVNALTVTIEVF